MQKIKLFCFPFAGGAASFYNPWRTLLPEYLELHCFELAGRGSRITESLYSSITEIVDEIMIKLRPAFESGPYALFGHSMGGIIVYELTKRISEQNMSMPVQIFISGKGPLHLPRPELKIYSMPDEEFQKNMIEMGGISEDFFRSPELASLFIPVIRNDMRLAETFEVKELARLSCNITVFYGEEEILKPADVEQWRYYTKGVFKVHYFKGGHFFIRDYTREIIDIISDTIMQTHMSC